MQNSPGFFGIHFRWSFSSRGGDDFDDNDNLLASSVLETIPNFTIQLYRHFFLSSLGRDSNISQCIRRSYPWFVISVSCLTLLFLFFLFSSLFISSFRFLFSYFSSFLFCCCSYLLPFLLHSSLLFLFSLSLSYSISE